MNTPLRSRDTLKFEATSRDDLRAFYLGTARDYHLDIPNIN